MVITRISRIPASISVLKRVVDHRFVVDRDELLADPHRDGMQPRPASTGQNDSAHVG